MLNICSTSKKCFLHIYTVDKLAFNIKRIHGTWDLATHQDSECGCKAKGQVYSEEDAVRSFTEHCLSHCTTAKHLQKGNKMVYAQDKLDT